MKFADTGGDQRALSGEMSAVHWSEDVQALPLTRPRCAISTLKENALRGARLK